MYEHMTDTCCPSNATGAKCALPRTHLIGILLLSLITIAQRHNTTARMDKHKHEECRAAKYSSIHVTQSIRLS